jgi:hypothetical protein
MWTTNEIQEATRSSIEALIRNEIPGVRVKEFAAAAERELFLKAILEHARRTSSISEVTRLGISQYQEGVCGSKALYFAGAKEANAEYQAVFAQSFDPLHRFISWLRDLGFDADICEEPGFGRYFAGNGKVRNGFSPIHVDFSPQDSPEWMVGTAVAQLAWNLYVQVPPTGGELLLWDRAWNPSDDVHQVPGNYFYRETVVNDATRLSVPVTEGEVIILNSRNFHAVADSRDRLAYGSFISCFADGRLRLFS